MARSFKPPIERSGNEYRVNLDIEERDLIQRLLTELRALLADPDEADDRLTRLFPPAYHQAGDSELDDEYQRLMREDLLTSRLKGLDMIDGVLGTASRKGPTLTEAQMSAFLQALNGIRLVLGTMLDVGEDHDIDDIGDDHPLVGEYQLYDFLSWVLDWSVRAVQG